MEAHLGSDIDIGESRGSLVVESSSSTTSVSARAHVLFEQDLKEIHKETDKNFRWLLVLEWIAAIVVAAFVSPITWQGVNSYPHIHLVAAVFYGGSLSALPLYLIKTQPGSFATRNAVAICQMLFSDLFIQLTEGRIETHFHVFGSLAFLSFYRDWRVLLSASFVVALTHLIRGLYWPQSIYGTLSPEPWRFLEHVFWVGFEDLWLIIAIKQALKDKLRRAEHQAELEQAKASVEGEVVVRTAQLKASEQAFKQLAETAPVGIFQTDAAGTNLFLNSELPRIMDCDSDVLLNGDWQSLLDAENRADLSARWKQSVQSRREFMMEAAIIGKSGRRIHVRTHAVPVLFESGDFRGFIGTVEDITDFKLTEQKLHLEKQLTAAFSESSSFDDAIARVIEEIGVTCEWDLVRFERSGKTIPTESSSFIWRSPQVSEQMLNAIAELDFANIQQLQTIKGLCNFEGYLAVPVLNGHENIGVLQLASIRVRALDEYGRVQLMGLGENLGQHITRFRAERLVKAREAMIQAIHNSVAEAIIALDARATVVSSNSAAAKIFLADEGMLSRRSLWDLIPSYGNQNFDETVWSTMIAALQQGVVRTWEGSGRKLNGELFPVEIALSEAGSGGAPCFVAVVRDISERKESEKRVAEFYSMVSHELRTPLTSIRGSLGLISGGLTGDIPSDAMELLGIASESCDRLIRLINDILDLKKLESGKFQFRFEKLRPGELVNLSMSQIDGLARTRMVKLESSVRCSHAILADKDRVLQVLTNLLSNAIKFSPQNTVVSVEVTDSHDGDFVRFNVRDHGPGIKDEHIGLLFGKFQQVDSSDARAQEGTGLGLAICKSIVEHLEGSIGVQTTPGKGSTFWFELPALRESLFSTDE